MTLISGSRTTDFQTEKVMSVDLTIGEITKRLKLLLRARGQFQVRSKFAGREVMLALYPAPHSFGILRITAGKVETDDTFLVELERGTELTVDVVAPAIATFPGQPKMGKVTIPVKLKIVTSPHKSRAKPHPNPELKLPGFRQEPVSRLGPGR